MKKPERVNNVVPFPISEKFSPPEQREDPLPKTEKVDILVCSNCGGTTFFLITDMTNRIACAECQCMVDAEWICGPESKYEA